MKSSNLTLKTLLYLGVFASVIILGIWILQIQFFQVFNEKIVIDNLKVMSKNIKEANSNIDELLFDYAYQNDICIQYYTETTLTDYNIDKKNCLLNNNRVTEYKNEIKKQDLSCKSENQ